MYFYFGLQFRILNRRFQEWGIPAWMGYVLVILLFLGFSFYLFYKTPYAPYLYCVVAISLLSTLNKKDRNEFLKIHFPKPMFYLIRSLESLVIALPFGLFLLYKQQFFLAGLLLLLSAASSLLSGIGRQNIAIPTPFYRFPFEYIQGFRQNWGLYALAYFIAWKAIEVDNVNLGIGSLVLIGLLGLSHYANTENDYFVWIYACSARLFLLKKIGAACGYFCCVSLPVILALCWFFPDHIGIVLLINILLLCLLMSLILAKYSAFPYSMSLPQVLWLSIGAVFPPLLLILSYYFLRKALSRLNVYLA